MQPTDRLLTVTAPLGLESGIVRIVEHDPRWADLFRDEAERLALGTAPLQLAFEHTGSTAVPGLAAKPVLDILAGYREPGALASCIEPICEAGYEHRGEQGVPGRQFFRRGQPRAFHLHLALVGSAFWRDHLDFRSLLRADPVRRAEYDALKRALAMQFSRDRERYTEGKTAFVLEALRVWRSSGEA